MPRPLLQSKVFIRERTIQAALGTLGFASTAGSSRNRLDATELLQSTTSKKRVRSVEPERGIYRKMQRACRRPRRNFPISRRLRECWYPTFATIY